MTAMSRKIRTVLNRLVVCVALILPIAGLAPTTQAAIITIDAAGFAEGTDLSHISPHVSLQDMAGSFGSGPITSRRSSFSDNLVFGTFELGWSACADRLECARGFGMVFAEAPQWVSMSMRLHEIADFGFGVSWFAFDAAGDLLSFGTAGTEGYVSGQFFAWNVVVPGMKSLVLGGGDFPSPGDFDRLSFAVGVPEPSTLFLSIAGLAGIGLRALRRRAS